MTTSEDLPRHYHSFEGDSSGLTNHLFDVHGITSPFDRPPVDQGGYLTLDRLHRQFHETRPSSGLEDARAALADPRTRNLPKSKMLDLIDRCRPLLEPSDAEATLAKIREVLNDFPLTALAANQQIRDLCYPPPRPIEVGDRVRRKGTGVPHQVFKVLDVLDDGAVLRLRRTGLAYGQLTGAKYWERAES